VSSPQATSSLPPAVAVVVVRQGRLPAGADDAVADAGGTALLVGSGTEDGGRSLTAAERVLWSETGDGLRPAALAARLAPWLRQSSLVLLPASADGRDLAPRLAARLGRPLLAAAETVALDTRSGRPPRVTAALSRLDDRVLVDVTVDGPAVTTVVPRRREVTAATGVATIERWAVGADRADWTTPTADPEVVGVLAPDLATLDLADATVVVAGGAGLASGLDDGGARAAKGVE